MTRLLIHVQYLKGIGHLQRVKLIAEAAAAQGMEIHIASGGLPLPGLDPEGATIHQLPALQAGPQGFSDLRNDAMQPIDENWRFERRDRMLALFEKIAPGILLIETFPFGRRALTFELLPLLEAARTSAPRPAILCSIRDILQMNRKPGRSAETVARLRELFDAVLIHGDPAFMRLEETFPKADQIADLMHYTGFVAAQRAAFEPHDDTPRGEVIVSMGGGAIGPALLDAALSARPKTPFHKTPWRLITGPHLDESDFQRLSRSAPQQVIVEPFRLDFRRLLSACRLSISYAGYNTVTDVLGAQVPGVLLTYSGPDGRETEQAMRAKRLRERGLVSVLSDAELSPERLCEAIEEAAALPPRSACPYDMNGAEKSVEILLDHGKRIGG